MTDIDLSRFEKEARAKAQKEQAAYEQQRRRAASEELQKALGAIDTAAAPRVEALRGSIEAVPESYRPAYDLNAIEELVTRRQIEETMANLGLSDSGSAGQGYAAAGQRRARADKRLAQEADAKTQKLIEDLAAVLADTQAKRLNKEAAVKQKADRDIAANQASLYKAAMDHAMAQYKAALRQMGLG